LWLFKQDAADYFSERRHIGLAAIAAKAPLLTFNATASRLGGARHVRA